MKKNIMLIGAFLEPGGEEEVITYLYKNLDRTFYNVYLCGPSSASFFEKHGIEKNELLHIEMKNKYDIKSLIQLIKYIKKYDIDLVHSHGNRGGLYGRVAAFISSKKPKSVWTLHLLIEENDFTISKFRKRIYTKVEKILNKYMTDHVISVSNDLETKYKVIYSANNITTIHNGIDTVKYNVNKIENSKESNELTFGFISRLSKQKGLQYLMAAMNELVSKYKLSKNIKLYIAGTGEEEEFLKAQIELHGLERNVNLLGFRKDVPNILQQLDVLILPSLFEGFPMIILESLCSGTPVIASRVNGIPEVIIHNKNGLLVEPRDIQGLINGMEFYINNPEMIKKHGDLGRSIILSNFTKEIMLDKHKNLYIQLLD